MRNSCDHPGSPRIAARPGVPVPDRFQTPEADPLLRAGEEFAPAELQTMCLDGLLLRLTDDVYAVASRAGEPAVRAQALYRSSDEDLVVGRESALWIWSGHGPHRVPVQLLAANGRRRRRHLDRRHVHEVRVRPEDVVLLGQQLVTTPARTVFDLMLGQPAPVVEEILRRTASLLGEDALRDYIGERRRVPGTRRLLTALDGIGASRCGAAASCGAAGEVSSR